MHSGPRLLVWLRFDFFLPNSLSDFARLLLQISGPGSLPPSLPTCRPSPLSYALSCRINISDLQPHSSAVKVCIWVFFPYVPFGAVDAVEAGRPFTQEYSLVVQSPAGGRGGESIKQLQYMHKGARPASSATSLSLPFIAH